MAEYIEREKLSAKIDLDNDIEKWTINDDELCSIPAADVAPVRHGRWERCFEDWRRQIEGSKCTACGFEHYGSCINYYHYCPNCGVKMDGGETP